MSSKFIQVDQVPEFPFFLFFFFLSPINDHIYVFIYFHSSIIVYGGTAVSDVQEKGDS